MKITISGGDLVSLPDIVCFEGKNREVKYFTPFFRCRMTVFLPSVDKIAKIVYNWEVVIKNIMADVSAAFSLCEESIWI